MNRAKKRANIRASAKHLIVDEPDMELLAGLLEPDSMQLAIERTRAAFDLQHANGNVSNVFWEGGETALAAIEHDLMLAIDDAPEAPEVVCLCGSTRFKDDYEREMKRLTLDGKIVHTVGLFGHADGLDEELADGGKEMLDELHKRKIDRSNRVHVINRNGYVGYSTALEIEYAKKRGKDVTWMEEQ